MSRELELLLYDLEYADDSDTVDMLEEVLRAMEEVLRAMEVSCSEANHQLKKTMILTVCPAGRPSQSL